MSRDDLLATLQRIARDQKARYARREQTRSVLDGPDIELDHDEADKALIAYIGDPEIAAAFDAIDKWYA